MIYVITAVRDSVKHKRNNGGRKTEQGCTSSTMSVWLTNQPPVSIMILHLTNTRVHGFSFIFELASDNILKMDGVRHYKWS
jgi:hypothetical protein